MCAEFVCVLQSENGTDYLDYLLGHMSILVGLLDTCGLTFVEKFIEKDDFTTTGIQYRRWQYAHRALLDVKNLLLWHLKARGTVTQLHCQTY